jgi:hypothetical protein
VCESRCGRSDDDRQVCSETHWHPTVIQLVAGALMYTKYKFFLRIIMKRFKPSTHRGLLTQTCQPRLRDAANGKKFK